MFWNFLTITGDLSVNGAIAFTDSNSFTVDDPIFQLGNNNPGDTYDLGFIGTYNSLGTKYWALYRDASDSGKIKIVDNVTSLPTTTVSDTHTKADFVCKDIECDNLTASNNVNALNVNATNITGTNLAGTLSTTSQPITTLPNLTSIQGQSLAGTVWQYVNSINQNLATNNNVTHADITSSGRFYGPSGTVSLPGYTFTGDTNTGLYRINADQLGLAVGGNKALDLSTTRMLSTYPIRVPNNTAMEFSNTSTNLGHNLYEDSSNRLVCSWYDSGGNYQGDSFRVNADGTVTVLTSLAGTLSTTSQPITTLPNLTSIQGQTVASSAWPYVNSMNQNVATNSNVTHADITSTGRFYAVDGTVSSPGYTFTSDTNTGLYRIGSDNLGLTCGGTKILDLTGTIAACSGTIQIPSGSLSTPSLCFSSDTDTGMFLNGPNELGFTVGGETFLRVYNESFNNGIYIGRGVNQTTRSVCRFQTAASTSTRDVSWILNNMDATIFPGGNGNFLMYDHTNSRMVMNYDAKDNKIVLNSPVMLGGASASSSVSNLRSGNWTPTFTNILSFAGASVNNGLMNSFMQIGNCISFSMSFNITFVTTTNQCNFRFTLPVTPTFSKSGNEFSASGTAMHIGTATPGLAYTSIYDSDEIQCDVFMSASVDTTDIAIRINGQYRID